MELLSYHKSDSTLHNAESFNTIDMSNLTEDLISSNMHEICQEIEAIESVFMNDVKIKHFKQKYISVPQRKQQFELQIAAELQFVIYPQEMFPAQLTKMMSSNSAEGNYEGYEETKNQNPVRIRVCDLEYLPCFELTVLVPVSYPSTSPPLFSLNKQDFYSGCEELIQQRLAEIFVSGFTCLFDWHSYLQDEFVQDFADSNQIDCFKYFASKKEEFIDIQTRSKETFHYRFSKDVTYWPICYEEYFGSEFAIVDDCYHFFCKACMKDYLEGMIQNGKTEDFKWPQTNWNKMMTDENIREFVGAKMYEKLEKFKLQKEIDLSKFLTWCPIPECSAIANIVSKNIGQCTNCWFKFCLTWKESYHTGKRWATVGLGKLDFKNLSSEQQDEWIADQLNDFYVSKYSKNCPKWSVLISKITGCNKMIWWKCGVYFCWKWMKIITGYEHFSENPQCWDTTGQRDRVGLTDLDKNELKSTLFGSQVNVPNSILCPECKKSGAFTLLQKNSQQNLLKCKKWMQDIWFFCGKLAEPDHYLDSVCFKTS